MSYSGVAGTMLGAKVTDGEVTAENSIIVLVKSKRALSRLSRDERIPKWLSADGVRMRTDVMRMGSIEWQGWQNAVYCSDAIHNGVVSAFIREKDRVLGLSCAHVLEGKDGKADKPSPVTLQTSEGQLLEAGVTIDARRSSGKGFGDGFGFADVAAFSVKADWAIRNVDRLLPIEAVSNANGAVYLQTLAGVRNGRVTGERFAGDNWFADYVIALEGRGTFEGDSGALWRLPDGRGVAIHAGGANKKSNGETMLSVAMSLPRALSALGLASERLVALPGV
jgi:hypothetical protein